MRLLFSILAVMGFVSPVFAADPAPVLITDAYYISNGGTAVHLIGHEVQPIIVSLGAKFNLNLSWRTPEAAQSPCDERAKVACRLVLEVYRIATDGSRTWAYGWKEGLEVRLNSSKYSMTVNIPEEIPRDTAPTGEVVLVAKWMHGKREVHRFELQLRITG